MLVVASTRPAATEITHVNVMVTQCHFWVLWMQQALASMAGAATDTCFGENLKNSLFKGNFLTNSLACYDSLSLAQGEEVFGLILVSGKLS